MVSGGAVGERRIGQDLLRRREAIQFPIEKWSGIAVWTVQKKSWRRRRLRMHSRAETRQASNAPIDVQSQAHGVRCEGMHGQHMHQGKREEAGGDCGVTRARTSCALVALFALLLTACGEAPAPAPEVEVPSWAKVAPEQIAEAKKHGVPVAFENDLGMRFVLIPAGTFLMGSPDDEKWRDADEVQREVTISKPFYMSIYEVTNAQYRAWRPDHNCGEYVGHDMNGDRQPVVEVSWLDATDFGAWVSDQDESRPYRLPTEAEWEYACRGGTTSRFWWGESETEACENANLADNSFALDGIARVPLGADGYSTTAPVAHFAPNPWGVYDMLGNVWEWCSDWYTRDYADLPMTDPAGPPSGAVRAVRGSGWASVQWTARSASRGRRVPDEGLVNLGFRLVSPLSEPGAR